ncbi:MAG TPA: hypothetical protein VGQ80_13350, partial [Acidimicrobiia bacterium]|nr:hypothetical protein [Acidimicrobiia bacterium]
VINMRRLALPAAAALLVVAPVAASVRPAAGEGRFSGTFASFASADGLRVTLVDPGVTLTKTLVDLGAPSAQATVNSLGESRAFAAVPYPGDTAVAAPGLLRGAGNIPAPAYPLYVASDHPAIPKQEAGDGPYALRAESTDVLSRSLSNAGVRINGLGDLGLSRSESSAESSSDGVTAHARTETSAFSVGPLRIGHVLSVADTVLGRSGQLTRNAATSVVGAMVGSAPVEITSSGLSVAGAAGPAADTSALNQALAGAGITVEVLPKAETATGVTSPAVRVTQQDKSGTSVSYVLGRATASVEGTAAASDGLVEQTGDAPAPDTGSAETASDTGGATEADSSAPDSPAPNSHSPVNDSIELPILSGSTGAAGYSFRASPGAAAETSPPAEIALQAPARVGKARRAVAAAPQGADSRVAIIATRALLNGGDTRSMYAAGLVGIGLCLALALGLRFFSRAARSGGR